MKLTRLVPAAWYDVLMKNCNSPIENKQPEPRFEKKDDVFEQLIRYIPQRFKEKGKQIYNAIKDIVPLGDNLDFTVDERTRGNLADVIRELLRISNEDVPKKRPVGIDTIINALIETDLPVSIISNIYYRKLLEDLRQNDDEIQPEIKRKRPWKSIY